MWNLQDRHKPKTRQNPLSLKTEHRIANLCAAESIAERGETLGEEMQAGLLGFAWVSRTGRSL